ncbi:MAG: hypothetical protein LCI02_20020 [Proteobacteria bacterium]|nr:hypothetical protein [Pseudomonadota bacterium]
MASGRWHVRLLGGLQLQGADPRLGPVRLPSRACGALLARLALWPEREHGREELIELLWPGVDLGTGRNRLRQTLSTLKALLEPPGAAAVIVADRRSLRAAPGALSSDAQQFEQRLRAGQPQAAAALYGGELLPGFFDEWICDERRRLCGLAERLHDRLQGGGGHGHVDGDGGDAASARAASTTTAPDAPLHAPHATHATHATHAPHAPPAATPAPALSRHALPTYLTRYFGIEARAARLRGQVSAHRLVTLVGPGGIGKTRLAVELAQALRDTPDLAGDDGEHPRFDLVAFVALAGCDHVDTMLDALGRAFGLGGASADLGERLATALAGQRALLVLDNLEQLLPAAASVVAALLQRLPALHVLATSRRVLAIDGEREVALAPLPLPAADADLAGQAFNPAVAMFIDRARAVRADFHLNPRNADAVVALVRLLGGAPLAIELAAARLRSVPLAEMLQRLDGRADGRFNGAPGAGLALLARAGPRGGLDARHAAMAEVIAWSWKLLPPALQHTLAAMTVFVGGFTAEAAAAVLGTDVALQLDEAVQHSLLTGEWQLGQGTPGAQGGPGGPGGPDAPDRPSDDTLRFRFTEPVREFALAWLLQQQPAAEVARLRRAHRDWWPRWMAALGPTVPLAAFRAEGPNLVAALASAEADGEPEAGVRLALALRSGLAVVPLAGSGIDTLQRLLARVDDAALRSAGLSLLAVQEYEAGLRERAEQHAQQALDAAPPRSAPRASALQMLARLRWTAHNDRDGACRLLDEAEPLAESLGEHALLGTLLAQRAYIDCLSRGRAAEAGRLFERQRALLQTLGNRHDCNAALYHRVNLDYQLDRYAECLAGARDLADRARAEQDWALLSKADNVLGGAYAEVRQWRHALPCFLEAAEVAWADGAHFAWAYAVWNVPTSLLRCGQAEAAARLMAFAARHWSSRYGELSASDLRAQQRLERLARHLLGAGRAAEAAAQGRALNPAQAMQALRRAVTAATSDPRKPVTPPRTGG